MGGANYGGAPVDPRLSYALVTRSASCERLL